MQTTRRIALATYAPGHIYGCGYLIDSGMSHLKKAFEDKGLVVGSEVWSEDIDWPKYDAILTLFSWDYHQRYEDFLQWVRTCERSGVKLFNQPEMLRWNSDKKYLAELQSKGVPCIDSVFVGKGQAVDLESLLNKWPRLFIKPIVGANGSGVMKVFAGDDIPTKQQEFQRLLNCSYSGLIVQPYLESAEKGELSVAFVDGIFSHAVRMTIGNNHKREYACTERCQVDEKASRVASKALKALPFTEPPTYLRVDLVEDGSDYKVMEAELIEPCMYFNYETACNFVDIILDKLNDSMPKINLQY